MEKKKPGWIKNLFQKTWSEERISKYIGRYQHSYFAYASDPATREKAASGGVVSALLEYLITHQHIDGALVCRSVVNQGSVQPQFFIAGTKNEVLDAQGSKYMAVDFNQDALPLIRQFNGRLAVVALPCDVSHLRRACELDKNLSDKIGLVISLFCGHNSLPELTEMVIEKIKPHSAALTHFCYRQGHWRGQLQAEFDNGEVICKPFSRFSNYQNLFFFCQPKCHHCHDHCGYDSDISVGDIWSSQIKKNPVKHSAVILRTGRGSTAFDHAVEAGVLAAHSVGIKAICQGQARSLPFHYNISARAKAGKRLGITIKDSVQEHVRWNDHLAAWIALFNDKLSRTPAGKKWIQRTPNFFLRIYLLVFKGLQSF